MEREQYVSLWTDIASWVWLLLSLCGISYCSHCNFHSFNPIRLKSKQILKSAARRPVVASVAASCELVSSRNMNEAQKWWSTVFPFLKLRIASSMTCNLESGSWCRAIWERLSTTHLVGTVALAEIDLDISNEDQRYNLPVNNHEGKTKVEWGLAVPEQRADMFIPIRVRTKLAISS